MCRYHISSSCICIYMTVLLNLWLHCSETWNSLPMFSRKDILRNVVQITHLWWSISNCVMCDGFSEDWNTRTCSIEKNKKISGVCATYYCSVCAKKGVVVDLVLIEAFWGISLSLEKNQHMKVFVIVQRFLLCFPDGTQSENVSESCDWTTQTGNQWTWPEANHSLFFSGESEQQQQGVLSLQLGVTARFHPLPLCQGEWKLLNCIFYLVYLLHESEFLLLT